MRAKIKHRPVKHIGFEAAEERAREGGAYNPAGAIAAAARNASPAAKKRNPRLLKVRGAKKGAMDETTG